VIPRYRIGIIKFFRNEEFLDDLIKGMFYCNTPEFYRLSKAEGVSDLNESCMHSYRMGRDEFPPEIIINGIKLTGLSLTATTIQIGGQKDKWLHCWFALDIVDNSEYLRTLIQDVNKIRNEFGSNYAFILRRDIPELVRRLSTKTDLEINYGKVKYSKNRTDWGCACKSDVYEYQREFRFLLGECEHTNIECKKVRYEEGFEDIVHKNKKISITDNESNIVQFFLSKDECYSCEDYD